MINLIFRLLSFLLLMIYHLVVFRCLHISVTEIHYYVKTKITSLSFLPKGVSCDSCLKTNFSDRRYKCLQCDNYDLCGSCFDVNAQSQNHIHTHPMQCILTKKAYGFIINYLIKTNLFSFHDSI